MPGRPKLDAAIIALIRRMSKGNPLWGAPRIRDELALLGHEVAESTVAKYMVKHQDSTRQQTWRTFLRNHLDVSAGCDFFTVPTLTIRLLYVFVVLSHDRRRILHLNVTKYPTAAWTAQQLTEAFPGDHPNPRFLHRDRDSIDGDVVRERIAALGLKEVASAKQVPGRTPSPSASSAASDASTSSTTTAHFGRFSERAPRLQMRRYSTCSPKITARMGFR